MSKFKLEEVTYEMSGYSPGFKIIDSDIDIEDIEREDGSIAYLHGISEDEAQLIVIALEKQTPKMTKYSVHNRVEIHSCPNCGYAYLNSNKTNGYCNSCGQSLIFF